MSKTIDFAVGNGGSAAGYYSDFTRVDGSISGIAAALPEPETYAMFGVGLLAVGGVARRRKLVDAHKNERVHVRSVV